MRSVHVFGTCGQKLVQARGRDFSRLALWPPRGFHVAVPIVRVPRLVKGPAAAADNLAATVIDDFEPVAGGVRSMPCQESLRGFCERYFLICGIRSVIAAEQGPQRRDRVFEGGTKDDAERLKLIIVFDFEQCEAHCDVNRVKSRLLYA